MQTGSWECTREGLLYARTLISFQRFPKPAGSFDVGSLRSYGALRPEQVGDDIVLPLPDDEAVWIGALLSREDEDGFAVHACLADGRRITLSGAWRASLLTIIGYTDASVLQPLARPPVRRIDVMVGSAAISIAIVAPDEFIRLTGRDGPGPLHDDSAYKGWRLP